MKNVEDFVTQQQIHALSVEKGWWEAWPDPIKRIPESLMLIVSELAEVLEEYRNGNGPGIYYKKDEEGRDKPEGIAIELADAVIRIRDTAESLGIDLELAIGIKHNYNKGRPFQHGRKRA